MPITNGYHEYRETVISFIGSGPSGEWEQFQISSDHDLNEWVIEEFDDSERDWFFIPEPCTFSHEADARTRLYEYMEKRK